MRLLEGRGLVTITPEDQQSGKRLLCQVTALGEALHTQIIPIARARQAQTLLKLAPEQRRNVLRFANLATICRCERSQNQSQGQ